MFNKPQIGELVHIPANVPLYCQEKFLFSQTKQQECAILLERDLNKDAYGFRNLIFIFGEYWLCQDQDIFKID
jgi:hypothetical protein